MSKQRNELFIERTFIMIDDWKPKLKKAFDIWEKLYVICDRTDKLGYGVIKLSIEKVAKKLGMSKSTLYRYIKPLWDYELIDLQKYDDWEGGSKPTNIIVYAYPKNNKELATRSLIKNRDYETEYVSKERSFAIKGGRPRKSAVKEEIPNIPSGPVKDEPIVGDLDTNNCGFQEENGEGFTNETPSVSETKPNNILNILSNTLNILCNTINTLSLKIDSLTNKLDNNYKSKSSSFNSNKKLYSELKQNPSVLQTVSLLEQKYNWNHDLANLVGMKLIDKNIHSVSELEIAKALASYEFALKKVENVSCPAGLLVKQVLKVKNAPKSQNTEQKVQKNPNAVPFHNWLEGA